MKEISAIIRWGERWGLTLRWMCQEPESQEPKAAQEEKEKLSGVDRGYSTYIALVQ